MGCETSTPPRPPPAWSCTGCRVRRCVCVNRSCVRAFRREWLCPGLWGVRLVRLSRHSCPRSFLYLLVRCRPSPHVTPGSHTLFWLVLLYCMSRHSYLPFTILSIVALPTSMPSRSATFRFAPLAFSMYPSRRPADLRRPGSSVAYSLRSYDPLPLAFARGFDSSSRSLTGAWR